MSGIRISTLSGEKAFLKGDGVENLKSLIQSDVLLSSHVDYDLAHNIFNGMIIKRHAIIVRSIGRSRVVRRSDK